MLRSFLIYLSKAIWAQKLITGWKFAWQESSRFVAGNTIQDAITVVKELNARGINTTLDHLGESTTTREEAVKATDDILELLEQINLVNVQANVSIKLTQIGLALDESLCAFNLEQILACARQHKNFIRIDMEDTPYTEKTICMYRQMRANGYTNAGLVIQSYLRRSEEDIRGLISDGTHFRLVKGAYNEPPDLAYPKKADVDANFDLLARIMIDGALSMGSPSLSADGLCPPLPAIATHDANRIAIVKTYLMKVGLPKTAIEFQMLYGIRRDLQDQCNREGYPVRIYIPYGINWYPYFMRRLAERPANVWFFISNFFRK